MTLIEILVVLAVTAIIAVPLTSWAISTLQHQDLAQKVLRNAVGTGMLASQFSRDVAGASQVLSGVGGDCDGGAGAGGDVRLILVSSGAAPTKTVYSEARPSSADSTSTQRSLWRRVCDLSATSPAATTATELFDQIIPGSATAACTEPGGTGLDTCGAGSSRVRLEVTPAGPDAARPVELHATSRLSGTPAPSPDGGNRAPVALIDASPLVGSVTTNFRFDAAPSTDPDPADAANLTYSWEFPDGSGGTTTVDGQVVTRSFDDVGEHTVLLRVTDGRGGSNVAAVTVRVMNLYPTAVASVSPGVGVPGTNFTFSAAGSNDPDGSPLTYTWDFGDPIGEKSGGTVTEDFSGVAASKRQVTLTVSDPHGGSDTAVVTVDLGGTPGDIEITPELVVTPGRAPRVGTVGEGRDPLEVSFAAAGGTAGADTTWVLVDVDAETTVATSDDATFRNTFGPGDAGVFQIARQLRDGSGPYGSPTTFRVNRAPTAAFTVATAAAGALTEFRGAGPGGSTDDDLGLSYDWDFGDGGRSSNPDPSHAYANPGTYRVSLTVTDLDGEDATVVRDVVIPGVPSAPPAPTWTGNVLTWPSVPGADEYIVELTCNGMPQVPEPRVAQSAAPRYDAGAYCVGGGAGAAIRVVANGATSLPSPVAGRPT